jgi:hypothetical protein
MEVRRSTHSVGGREDLHKRDMDRDVRKGKAVLGGWLLLEV